jgi:hypothetical protein
MEIEGLEQESTVLADYLKAVPLLTIANTPLNSNVITADKELIEKYEERREQLAQEVAAMMQKVKLSLEEISSIREENNKMKQWVSNYKEKNKKQEQNA